MNEVYRSYEVLVEETARNHHARKSGKTKRELAPNRHNTEQALKTTHEVFQDAICYYILCILGLIKDGKDRNGKVASPLWSTISGVERLSQTHEVIQRLGARYPQAPFAKATNLTEFFNGVYGSRTSDEDRTAIMAALLAQIEKKDGSLDCGDFAEFARDNGLRFCSPDSSRVLPGCAPIDLLFWRLSKAKMPEEYWNIIQNYWNELQKKGSSTERAHYLKAFSEIPNKKPFGIEMAPLFQKCA